MTYMQAIELIGNGNRPTKAAMQLFRVKKWTWAVMLRNYAWNMLTYHNYPDAIVPTEQATGSYQDISMSIYSHMPKNVQVVARELRKA